MDNYLLWTKWLRISYNDVFALGIGFDFSTLILAFYLGPVTMYLGYNPFEE